MKPEYDFSTGERGRFYRPDAVFQFPIYLEPDLEEQLAQVAAQEHIDVQDLVNKLLRANLQTLQSQL